MPGRWGEWMLNDGWGVADDVMKGWLWVQGCWEWGIVLTWHVQLLSGRLHWMTCLWKKDTLGVGQIYVVHFHAGCHSNTTR